MEIGDLVAIQGKVVRIDKGGDVEKYGTPPVNTDNVGDWKVDVALPFIGVQTFRAVDILPVETLQEFDAEPTPAPVTQPPVLSVVPEPTPETPAVTEPEAPVQPVTEPTPEPTPAPVVEPPAASDDIGV